MKKLKTIATATVMAMAPAAMMIQPIHAQEVGAAATNSQAGLFAGMAILAFAALMAVNVFAFRNN